MFVGSRWWRSEGEFCWYWHLRALPDQTYAPENNTNQPIKNAPDNHYTHFVKSKLVIMFPGGDQIYVNPIRNGHHHLPVFVFSHPNQTQDNQAWKLREQKPGAVIDKRDRQIFGERLISCCCWQIAYSRPHQNTKCQETPRHAKQIPDARIGTRNEQLIGREREMCQKMQD